MTLQKISGGDRSLHNRRCCHDRRSPDPFVLVCSRKEAWHAPRRWPSHCRLGRGLLRLVSDGDFRRFQVVGALLHAFPLWHIVHHHFLAMLTGAIGLYSNGLSFSLLCKNGQAHQGDNQKSKQFFHFPIIITKIGNKITTFPYNSVNRRKIDSFL